MLEKRFLILKNLNTCKILTPLFRLLKPIFGALAVLVEEVQSHIKQAGGESIAGLKGDTMATDFVENMLTVHKKYRWEGRNSG